VRKRVTRLRSKRSKAGRSSLGKIVCRVRRVFFVWMVVLRIGFNDCSVGATMEVKSEVRMSLVHGRLLALLSGSVAIVVWFVSWSGHGRHCGVQIFPRTLNV